ncbi:MAG: DUF262 domain-containing protein [Muribaculaceae bacterium]|nr:DUF262 domain-containing protein [Muribaculaceae bacterium]
MDLTNINNLIGNPKPTEMPVSELLTGSFSFSIPSYQRGYRWESSERDDEQDAKQVDDLLNDITSFAIANMNKEANYYLQPLMVKPRQLENGSYVWDVLDGQQRLTTMLLILICLNEKLYPTNPLKLYKLSYQNRANLDFEKISFDPNSNNYNYPLPSTNLDSYYIRKAKDRIERWYDNQVSTNQPLQDKIKELLFYPDLSRGVPTKPALRAKFIWYNAAPYTESNVPNGDRMHDIEIFNRLNRGKISLTDSELIKALFLLCIKGLPHSGSSLMSAETLVRKWDEMGKKFQNNGFWKMISPKNKEYSNRMDLLFDFIKDCNGESDIKSSYRFYYKKMHQLLSEPNAEKIEELWNEVKMYFDTLFKWHENVTTHNYIGFLVDNGKSISEIYHDQDITKHIKECLDINNVDDIDNLSYQDRDGFIKIRKILLLFNVLTCEKFSQKFPYDQYRDNCYDVEHVNSQTDNPIEKIEEKKEWIQEHAIQCLKTDRMETEKSGDFTTYAKEARDLIIEGIQLLKYFKKNNNKDIGNKFKPYRTKVENYYASGNTSIAMNNKDAIGNLTLLNSTINREYKNALFPKKLRVLKRSDQEGVYIPLCTKYMFLKYYSNPIGNASAFSMMRWKEADQRDYTEAIKDSLRSIL